MRLEKIEATASRDKVKLTFDDETTMRVPLSVVGDLGLYPKLELTEADLDKIAEEAGRASAKLRAVRIMAASGVSEQELRRKLRQKGETDAHAEEAIAWLEELELLDDRAAARRMVEKGVAKGYGKARIRQMLYEKGIARELWDEALMTLPEADDAIDRYLASHLTATADQKQLKRITDALIRRGHSWEDIRAGLSRYRVSVEEESF